MKSDDSQRTARRDPGVIYLDRNATGPVHPEVREAVQPFLDDRFGNPSAPYAFAREAKRHVDRARESVAALLGCEPKQLVFTSGGTEANNLAIKGAFLQCAGERRHIVVSAVEHPSVRESCLWLRRWLGADVSFVPPRPDGRILAEAVAEAMRPDTFLVSVMAANNETGVLMPVREIAEITRDRGVLFHVDGVQAAGRVPVDVRDLGCDFFAISGHKFGALKGVGALYVRDPALLTPILSGGHQERGLRAGTENVPGIVSLGTAAEVARRDMDANVQHCLRLRAVFDGLTQRLPMTRLNGHRDLRLPNTVNLCCLYADAMSVVLALSAQNIFVGTGSACASHTQEPSQVLKAMGLSDMAAWCSIRISFGPELTLEQAEYAAERIAETVENVRLVTAPESVGVCDENCPCFLDSDGGRGGGDSS